MDAAKAAISKHLGNSGKHTTTHHEAVAPAVQHETVKPSLHEETTTAVDREVHQDHYHTSVQPIKDGEVLPEKHSHNVVPVEHVQREHDDQERNARTLQAQAAQFKNEQVVADTVNTSSVAPTVGGEHVHHHVHETVQPVVHKTTVQPEVVHTTIPVHEVEHKAAQHHGAVQLPTMTMGEYQSAGRTLAGTNTEKTEHFRGEPQAVPALAPVFGADGVNRGEHVRDRDHAGAVDHSIGSERHAGSSNIPAAGNVQHTGTGATGTTGTAGAVPTASSTNTAGFGGDDATRKPSLMDKLNPKVDADGDGTKGFMS